MCLLHIYSTLIVYEYLFRHLFMFQIEYLYEIIV